MARQNTPSASAAMHIEGFECNKRYLVQITLHSRLNCDDSFSGNLARRDRSSNVLWPFIVIAVSTVRRNCAVGLLSMQRTLFCITPPRLQLANYVVCSISEACLERCLTE